MKTENDQTILLVDDEEGIRTVLGIALADLGYHIQTAENGDSAMRLFREHKPAIILTDIKMPGMDGIELLRMVKQENPETEVIMITGHGDIDLAIRSLKFEATDFITKPINEDVLEIALKRARERITMRRKLREYTEGLEKLVEEKTRKLVDAERLAAIGQTVAGLSHSIKNIAGGLSGGAFVLEKGMETKDMESLHQGWEMVRANVDKISKLSMDLLNFAKTAEIKRQLCDPNHPVREVFDLLFQKAKSLGIELKMELGAHVAPFRFDPEGIHRCLMNLVTNAMDACACEACVSREKNVIIRTRAIPGWGVEYGVEDNGVGMGPSVKNKLFRYFFTTKQNTGNGIGLMMTKNVVEKHGGEITFKSEEGKGSLFVMRIPIPTD